MNVLMTTDTVGGVWVYAVQLARALQPYGVQISLATMGRPLSKDQRDEVDRLPHVEVFESAYKLEWMQDPWDDLAEAGRWLLEIAEKTRPDIVHLNNYAHGDLDWPAPVVMVGHSCVLSWHRAVRGHDAGPEWDRYRDEVTRGLRAADLVVAPTRSMLESLEVFYGPLPRRRTIWNGRDVPERTPQSKQQFVLTAGRLWDEAKNIAAVADLADRLPWPVRVAGEDQHPEGGRARFSGVDYLGRLSSDEMAREFAKTTIYVLPARYEPFGLTPLEAARSGCALVLGDIPTLRELWDGVAWFVPPDDREELASTIKRLIRNPRLRRGSAGHARRRARQLTADRMTRRYLSAYRCLQRRSGLRPVLGGGKAT